MSIMENQKFITDYNIGLDIGTNSVGWAVTDFNGHLLTHHGKNLMGARLFEEGATAEGRRSFRSTRRRMQRRKERIRLLQELFSPLILPIDDGFFIRLNESFLHFGDFGRANKHNIFNDPSFSDKDYYDQYPTIYHLRKALITEDRKMDIRLVYLALHHIVKYRGNFLHEGDLNFNGSELATSINDYIDEFSLLFDSNIYSSIDKSKLLDILTNSHTYRSQKKDLLLSCFPESLKKDKSIVSFINAILGYSFNLNDLFFSEDYVDESERDIKVSFSSADYEEKEDGYLDKLNDNTGLFLTIKKIYQESMFYEVLSGESTLSSAMVNKYIRHKEDLASLKAIIKTFFPDKYFDVFKSQTGNNYVNYIKSRKIMERTKCGTDDFYKFLKTILSEKQDEQEVSKCLQMIESGTFLPRLNSVENGAIPYQMNLFELEKILLLQGKYYPSLLSLSEKIKSLLVFKRPYYVGPLNPKSEFAWIEEIIKERVYPWNFDTLVDTDYLAEKFIIRMTNYCQIFPNEEVLPKESFLYSKYNVLNELNKIKLNDKPISLEQKKTIFEGLFKKKKSVSKKDLLSFLKKTNWGFIEEISGLSDEEKFSNGLVSFVDFSKILGTNFNELDVAKYEQIIKILTLFEDSGMRKKGIKKILPELDEKAISQLCKLKYKGWGRFSKKLLSGIYSSENKTIVETMYDTNKNFNEIIYSEELGFKQFLEAKSNIIEEISYQSCIEPLYCSPAIKRAVWQSILIVQELEKILNSKPKNIFVEVAKGEEEKKRTKSREKVLQELYDTVKKDCDIYNKELHETLKSKNAEKGFFDDERVFLYFMQYGRCMYSNEPLDLSLLNTYEIDHIVPQSYIKDNSFQNKVLVKRIENQYKSDTLAISSVVRNKMAPFWKFLLEKNLMGKKKYFSLMKESYDENDFASFLNRQLVETRQTTKEVINLLSNIYPAALITGIRAGLVSEIRSAYGYYKSRSLNDYHHAHDAYLNAIAGCFIKSIFKDWGNDYKINMYYGKEAYADFIKNIRNSKIEQRIKFSYIVSKMSCTFTQDGEIVWDEFMLDEIRKNIQSPFCFISKKQEFEANSDFYDQTLYGKNSNKTLVSRKSFKGIELPTEKYGGYSSIKPSYIIAISYPKGKKTAVKLINVPVKIVYQQKINDTSITNYIKANYGDEVTILKSRINKHQLIKYQGQCLYLSSADEAYNGTQLVVDPQYHEFLEDLDKDNKTLRQSESLYSEISEKFFDHFLFKLENHYPVYQNELKKLKEYRDSGSFQKLSYPEKLKFITILLRITSASASVAELGSFGISGSLGRKSRFSPTFSETEFINRSITGLYETKYKLI